MEDIIINKKVVEGQELFISIENKEEKVVGILFEKECIIQSKYFPSIKKLFFRNISNFKFVLV